MKRQDKWRVKNIIIAGQCTARKAEYNAYINSPLWRAKRAEALNHYGNKCEYCGELVGLHVHHKRYPRQLGTESLIDLQVLCEKCHAGVHDSMKLRKKRTPTPSKSKPRKTKFARRLWAKLTETQKEMLQKEFSVSEASIYTAYVYGGDDAIIKRIDKLVGARSKPRKQIQWQKRKPL